MSEKKPTLISTGNEIARPWVTPDTPVEFVQAIRKRYNWSPDQGINEVDILQISEALGISPAAYLIQKAHWMLIAKANPSSITVYNPEKGVETLPYAFDQVTRFLGNDGKHYRFQGADAVRLNEHGYSLPEIPLQRLGRLQYSPTDCGILVVYAAIQAKKPFVVKP